MTPPPRRAAALAAKTMTPTAMAVMGGVDNNQLWAEGLNEPGIEGDEDMAAEIYKTRGLHF